MKQNRTAIARGLLLAAFALPLAPAAAQDSPIVDPAPPVLTAPPPPTPVMTPTPVVTPPPAVQLPTQPTVAAPPTAESTAARPARTATRTTRSVTRAAPARRTAAVAAAPVATPAPEAVPAETAAAPVPLPVALPEPAAVAAPAEPARQLSEFWPFALGTLLLVGAALFLFTRRRRRSEESAETAYDEPVEPAAFEPAIVPTAMAAAPLVTPAPEPAFAAESAAEPALAAEAAGDGMGHVEQMSVGEPDPEVVAALTASSEAPEGRPWLEFLLRPLRAGTSPDSAVVQFELTVGNTGSQPARDVQLSTFMFAAGSPQESEMERLLIEPSGDDAAISHETIPAGGARRVEAVLAMSKESLGGEVLPVVVADARYRLPDGSEGRTTAAFEVGRPEGEGLASFPTDRSSGLLESVEARLHGDPQRT